MIQRVAQPPSRLAVLAARLRQGLGWPGLLGVGLLVAAGLFTMRTWPVVRNLQAEGERAQGIAPLPVSAATITAGTERPLVSGAEPGKPSQVLANLQKVVLDHGLAWPGAELAMQAATPATPARLDVRLVLRGGYLRIRLTLMRLIAEIPGLTIRELNFTRAGSEATEVEAKVVLGVFLRSSEGSPPRSATR